MSWCLLLLLLLLLLLFVLTVVSAGEIDNDISRFWMALVNGGVLKQGTNNREWSLSGGIQWIGGVNIFYNRECYDTIQNTIGNIYESSSCQRHSWHRKDNVPSACVGGYCGEGAEYCP